MSTFSDMAIFMYIYLINLSISSWVSASWNISWSEIIELALFGHRMYFPSSTLTSPHRLGPLKNTSEAWTCSLVSLSSNWPINVENGDVIGSKSTMIFKTKQSISGMRYFLPQRLHSAENPLAFFKKIVIKSHGMWFWKSLSIVHTINLWMKNGHDTRQRSPHTRFHIAVPILKVGRIHL